MALRNSPLRRLHTPSSISTAFILIRTSSSTMRITARFASDFIGFNVTKYESRNAYRQGRTRITSISRIYGTYLSWKRAIANGKTAAMFDSEHFPVYLLGLTGTLVPLSLRRVCKFESRRRGWQAAEFVRTTIIRHIARRSRQPRASRRPFRGPRTAPVRISTASYQ